jgi:hypothetical protein
MRIFQNREILGVKGNKHISDKTRLQIERLLELAKQGRVSSANIDDVVASTPGWEYGSVVEDYVNAAEIPNHPCTDVSISGGSYQRRAQQVSASLKKGCILEGIYFGDEGFLGFAFRERTEGAERRAFALQFPWTNKEKRMSYRHMLLWQWLERGGGGDWFCKAYTNPAEGYKFQFGEGPLRGPLGREFTQYIDSHKGE